MATDCSSRQPPDLEKMYAIQTFSLPYPDQAQEAPNPMRTLLVKTCANSSGGPKTSEEIKKHITLLCPTMHE